jgi:hypothetical protein
MFKYASQEFESLTHLAQRISNQDTRVFEPRKKWNKKVSFVDEQRTLILMKNQLSCWLSGLKIKGRYLVLLVRKNQRNSPST